MKNILIIFYTLITLLSGNTYKGNETTVSNIQEEVIVLKKPPFEYYKSVNIDQKRDESIHLSQTKAVTNNIIDIEEWFINNNLELNSYIVPNSFRGIDGDVPYFVRMNFQDNTLVQATYDNQYVYALYNNMFGGGRYLLVYDINTGEEKYAFDFIQYYYPESTPKEKYTEQEVNWVVIDDNVLYVSTAHNTYAHSSDNLNAFITAIDLEDKKILWRSDTLLANSSNFQVIGDTIITGYGFTDEKDYIYLIDKWTGEVYEKIDINSKADYFVIKEDILYVRTYDTDYQFEI